MSVRGFNSVKTAVLLRARPQCGWESSPGSEEGAVVRYVRCFPNSGRVGRKGIDPWSRVIAGCTSVRAVRGGVLSFHNWAILLHNEVLLPKRGTLAKWMTGDQATDSGARSGGWGKGGGDFQSTKAIRVIPLRVELFVAKATKRGLDCYSGQ